MLCFFSKAEAIVATKAAACKHLAFPWKVTYGLRSATQRKTVQQSLGSSAFLTSFNLVNSCFIQVAAVAYKFLQVAAVQD